MSPNLDTGRRSSALIRQNVFQRQVRLRLCLLPSRHHLVSGNLTPECSAGIAEAAERGKLFPAIGRTAPLSEAISAIVELEMTGLPKGKLVIVPTR